MPRIATTNTLFTGINLMGTSGDLSRFNAYNNPLDFLSAGESLDLFPNPGDSVYETTAGKFDGPKYAADYAKTLQAFASLSQRYTQAVNVSTFGVPNIDPAFSTERGVLLQVLGNNPTKEVADLFTNLPSVLGSGAPGDYVSQVRAFIEGTYTSGLANVVQGGLTNAYEILSQLSGGDIAAPITQALNAVSGTVPVIGWVCKLVGWAYTRWRTEQRQQAQFAYMNRPWVRPVDFDQGQDLRQAQRVLSLFQQNRLDELFGAYDYNKGLTSQCNAWLNRPDTPAGYGNTTAIAPTPFCENRMGQFMYAYQHSLKDQTGGRSYEAILDNALMTNGDWAVADIRNTAGGSTFGKRLRLEGDRTWTSPLLEEEFGDLRDPLDPRSRVSNDWQRDARDWWRNLPQGDGEGNIFKRRIPFAPGTRVSINDFEFFDDSRGNTGRIVSQYAYPAASVLVLSLWAQVVQMGPAAFCIDAKTERDRWVDVQTDVLIRLRTEGLLKGGPYSAAGVQVFNTLRRELGWPSGLTLTMITSDANPDWGKVRNLLRQSSPVLAMDSLYHRQRKFLDLGVLPYLSTEMPAIKRNSDMLNKLETNRGIFLSHPAVCAADPSCIPRPNDGFRYASADDRAFRDMVEWTQDGTNFGNPMNGKCFAIQNPQTQLMAPALNFSPSEPLAPVPSDVSPQFDLAKPGTGKGGGGAAVAALAVGGAAAAFTLLKGK